MLSALLEERRQRPVEELVADIGAPVSTVDVQLQGESVATEVSVRWADEKRALLIVEAVAFGPSSWHTQRVEERIHIPVGPSVGASNV
jgi:hypothetical protein